MSDSFGKVKAEKDLFFLESRRDERLFRLDIPAISLGVGFAHPVTPTHASRAGRDSRVREVRFVALECGGRESG